MPRDFRKFKLVPADEYSVDGHGAGYDLAAVEKQLRHYNPTARAMANLFVGMQDAIGKEKDGIAPDQRLHLINAGRMRFNALAQALGGGDGETAQQPAGGVDAQPPLPSYMMQAPAKVDKFDMRPAVDIPEQQMPKFNKLLEQSAGILDVSQRGEVVLRGIAIPGSSYSAVMRALYIKPKSEVRGVNETVAELKRIGVDSKLLGSRAARDLYKHSGATQAGSGMRKRKPMLRIY